jgi:hypothetical protein
MTVDMCGRVEEVAGADDLFWEEDGVRFGL